MGRHLNGENTGRNLAIAGGSLLVVSAAAGVGALRILRNRAERPDASFEWGLSPFSQEVERQTADLSAFGGRKYRHHLAVLAVDGRPYDDHLSRSEGKPALAIKEENGLWRAGPIAGLAEIDQDGQAKRGVIVPVGATALGELQVGIMDETRFVPFDTEALDVSSARDIRKAYPDVPLLGVVPFEPPTIGVASV
jgi:hypothetical protein